MSALVDRPIATISGWIKREDWPFAKRAPWARAQVPMILRWSAETIQRGAPSKPKGGGDTEDEVAELRKQKLTQEVRKLRANADQAELLLARDKGELVPLASVRERYAEEVTRAKGKLMGLGAEVASACEGLDAAGIQTVIDGRITQILIDLADGLNQS